MSIVNRIYKDLLNYVLQLYLPNSEDSLYRTTDMCNRAPQC